jgi:hypothetical protein
VDNGPHHSREQIVVATLAVPAQHAGYAAHVEELPWLSSNVWTVGSISCRGQTAKRSKSSVDWGAPCSSHPAHLRRATGNDNFAPIRLVMRAAGAFDTLNCVGSFNRQSICID